jgi:ribonuclease Z
MTLRILMLGTGAALPDPDRNHSAILVTLDCGRHYLFDCGHGATRQMVRADVNPADVSWVFLTHLHHDHICDFPFFVISSWILNRTGAPLILGPKGTRRFVDHLLEDGAFQTDFRARSAYPVRQANLEAMRPEVREIAPGLVYQDEHVRVFADYVDHIPREICECYGVRLEAEGKIVAFSGDTKPCETMVELARDADLLIHECTFPEAFIEHRRKSGVGTFAHTSPLELGEIATKAGVKSLVATHFGHFDSLSPVLKRAAGKHLPVDLMGPHQLDAVIADIRRGYRGPVRLAHDLMRIDL